jgi:hypothetical protein
MELTFSELDNNNPYWDKTPKTTVQPKKKKVSFDDILTNMNLVVNKNGTLEFMSPIQKQYEEPKQETIDPSVKHSYIYNKYFKDYQNSNKPDNEVRTPKTMEEYRQMVLSDKLKEIRQKKMINEIKSKKMMFTATNSSNPQSNPRNINSSKNNLRMMSFH